MRKRSKKRIPQDALPWLRITKLDDDNINVFAKKTAKWISGNRRNAQTKIFSTLQSRDFADIFRKFYAQDQRLGMLDANYYYQKHFKSFVKSAFMGYSKPKNFCLYLGKGRTFNRKLFVSRPIVRKLMKTGAISGLQK